MTRVLRLPGSLCPTALAFDGRSVYVAGLAYDYDKSPDGTDTLVELGAGDTVVRTHALPAPLLALSVHEGEVLGITGELEVIIWPREGELRVIACPPALREVLDERLAHDELHQTAFAHLPPERVRGAALGFGDLRTPVAVAHDPLRAWAFVSARPGEPGRAWEWTANRWFERGPAPALFNARAAWHGVRDVLVLVGASKKPEGPAKVAEWDGAAWSEHPCRLAGTPTHYRLTLLALAGGPRAVGVEGKSTYVYGREGVFSVSHGSAGEQYVLEPLALEGTRNTLVLHSVDPVYDDGAVRYDLRSRDLKSDAEYVDESAPRSPAPAAAKPAKKPTKKAAKQGKTLARARGAAVPLLGELFPDVGFATMMLDALMPFSKGGVRFDLDAWVSAGLEEGRLTIAPTDDPDPVHAWKEQNELDLHPELQTALLALAVPPAALAKVTKLDLTSSPKKVIRKFAPQFDGESALGDSGDVRGVAHLKGLKTIKVTTLADFARLVDAPALEEVAVIVYKSAEEDMSRAHKATLAALEKRGVRVVIKRL